MEGYVYTFIVVFLGAFACHQLLGIHLEVKRVADELRRWNDDVMGSKK